MAVKRYLVVWLDHDDPDLGHASFTSRAKAERFLAVMGEEDTEGPWTEDEERVGGMNYKAYLIDRDLNVEDHT